jgi:adenosylmethionine-8-amino-7-oxononanoate aminotransferase
MVRYVLWQCLTTVEDFLQGGTYAGNAVACAAAIAVADVMKEEKILDNVNAR